MHNIKLTVAYDGTDFHGWQIQPGKPTIQGALTDVARKLTQEERVLVYGAGRTDAGVHALGQGAHFKTQSNLTPAEFHRAFNALLPPSIRVTSAEEVGPDFHARWQAQAKTYRYRIFRGRVLLPFEWRYVLHYPYPLDEAAMAEAAGHFVGLKDFTSFAAAADADDGDRNPVREILRSEILPSGWGESREIVYEVRGKSFLRYMVRKITGTLIDVGKGKLKPEDIPQLFELRDRSKSGPTVPPQGLFLVNVEYPEPWKS